jgi:hypothetical protein
MDDRIEELTRSVEEAHAYMAALSVAVACLCEVTPLDPGKITSRFETLRASAPPEIAARAGQVLAALLSERLDGRGAPSS